MNTFTSKPVSLGNVVYIKGEERDSFRPCIGTSVAALLFGGVFALMFSYQTVLAFLWDLNVVFGWQFPLMGVRFNRPADPPGFFVIVILGFSLVPAILVTATLRWLVQLIGFLWRQPTFDYSSRVFRRGQRTVCHLSDISEIHLLCVTDPSYPKLGQFALSFMLRDGSWHPLEWRFQRCFGKGNKPPYTDLGKCSTVLQQETVRVVAAEVAERVGVPLTVSEEHGNFTPSRGM